MKKNLSAICAEGMSKKMKKLFFALILVTAMMLPAGLAVSANTVTVSTHDELVAALENDNSDGLNLIIVGDILLEDGKTYDFIGIELDATNGELLVPARGEVTFVFFVPDEDEPDDATGPEDLPEDTADFDIVPRYYGTDEIRMRLVVDDYYYTLNGATLRGDVAPFITDGRTMVPLRIVSEGLGADVDWDAATRTVTVYKDGETLELTVDIPLPGDMGTPVIVGGRTFVPVRYVVEELGAEIDWNPTTRAVYIFG